MTKNLTVSLIDVAKDCEKVLDRVKEAGMISEKHNERVRAKQAEYD